MSSSTAAPACEHCGGELRLGRQSGRWFHVATQRYDCLRSAFDDEPLTVAAPRLRHLPWRARRWWHVLVLSWAEPVPRGTSTMHSPSALFVGSCYCQRKRVPRG